MRCWSDAVSERYRTQQDRGKAQRETDKQREKRPPPLVPRELTWYGSLPNHMRNLLCPAAFGNKQRRPHRRGVPEITHQKHSSILRGEPKDNEVRLQRRTSRADATSAPVQGLPRQATETVFPSLLVGTIRPDGTPTSWSRPREMHCEMRRFEFSGRAPARRDEVAMFRPKKDQYGCVFMRSGPNWGGGGSGRLSVVSSLVC